jgi:hypothetical protein
MMCETSEAYCPRPRTSILIGMNALIWIGLAFEVLRHATAFGYILYTMALIVALFMTTVAQVVIHFGLRRERIGPVLRTLIFLTPTLGLLGFGALTPRRPDPVNRKQESPSPSGKYVLSVPNADGDVWKVTIRDAQGNLVYKDEESTFLNHFGAYWVWDEDDRVWLYNGDDGCVYFWETIDGVWTKAKWGYARSLVKPDKEIDRAIKPPEPLFPPYVRRPKPNQVTEDSIVNAIPPAQGPRKGLDWYVNVVYTMIYIT